ncbi:MAG: PrsW family intramembrane metalloprotease [Planctomycetota bacterium JB042]
MPTAFDFLAGALPGLLWLSWFWRQDDHEPEPRALVALAFLGGLLAAYAVLVLRTPYEAAVIDRLGGLPDWVDSFVVTATLEETAKALPLFLAVHRGREWDEPLDGIVYGVAVALGFGAIENAYFAAAGGGVSLILARSFTAMLAHAACTGAVGLALGVARLPQFRAGWWLAAAVFLAAILAHGAFDLLLLAEGGRHLLALLLVLPLLLVTLSLEVRWARRLSPRFHPEGISGRSGAA